MRRERRGGNQEIMKREGIMRDEERERYIYIYRCKEKEKRGNVYYSLLE